jgi:hypothetical protein
MKSKDLIIGVLLAILTCAIGSFVFIEFFTGMEFYRGLEFYKTHGLLGKIITLGAILNLIVFFVLLKKNKDFIGRGIILGMILLTIVTFFV